MGLVQRFVMALVSKERGARWEAESRAWILHCTSCGLETSVWDAGGIRAGATGRTSTKGRCRGCGKLATHTLHRREDG